MVRRMTEMWEGCKIANLGCLYVYIYACCLSYQPLRPNPEGVKIGPVSATPHSDILICMSQGRRRSDITSSQPVLKTSKQNSFLLSFSYAISDKSKPIKTTKLCLCKLKKIITYHFYAWIPDPDLLYIAGVRAQSRSRAKTD